MQETLKSKVRELENCLKKVYADDGDTYASLPLSEATRSLYPSKLYTKQNLKKMISDIRTIQERIRTNLQKSKTYNKEELNNFTQLHQSVVKQQHQFETFNTKFADWVQYGRDICPKVRRLLSTHLPVLDTKDEDMGLPIVLVTDTDILNHQWDTTDKTGANNYLVRAAQLLQTNHTIPLLGNNSALTPENLIQTRSDVTRINDLLQPKTDSNKLIEQLNTSWRLAAELHNKIVSRGYYYIKKKEVWYR